ncbi:Probable RNA-directed DNA polymerase from transposon BS [Eumeta japonica]|uniref:Probable RNA-directed DNA polymerase from transposon BS n=1 Tax=Eumeta variegata TaxID=151549 RepID=A0A4C1SSY7_EUMVA|nr:Probable RNA-directed DNA polymerase from transposon BS [Eumeta japonica]
MKRFPVRGSEAPARTARVLAAPASRFKGAIDDYFGFPKGRSTTEAGVEVIQQIFGAWEASRDAIGVFCDLEFGCDHHDTLIRKVRHYGVKDLNFRALRLLESYLSCKVQSVDINGERSSVSAVSMGVPEGSVFGPFLF